MVNYISAAAAHAPILKPDAPSEELLFWKKFQVPIIIKETANVASIAFSPQEPCDFVVCSGSKMQLYSASNLSLKRTFSRGREAVTCSSFRQNGKLVVNGDAAGSLQVYELSTREPLRVLQGHSSAIRMVNFSVSKTDILSASDDCTVRIWDMPGEREILCLKDFQDSVRHASFLKDSPNIIVTGSYDNYIRLWDRRSPLFPISAFSHNSPVTAACSLGGGFLMASAGSNYIKIWDILGCGSRLVHESASHLKAISDLQYDPARNKLLSCSLDQSVKVMSLESYDIEHSMAYPSAILSMALSPDPNKLILAVGMVSGLLSLKRRQHSKNQANSTLSTIQPNSRKHFLRGALASNSASLSSNSMQTPTGSVVVTSIPDRPKRYRAYDKFLKKFMIRRALDEVLRHGDPEATFVVLEEIHQRQAFKQALADKTEKDLIPLFHFILKNITDPRYSRLLCDLCVELLILYSHLLGKSSNLDELLIKLHTRLYVELGLQNGITSILGSLNMIITTSLHL